MQLFIGKFESLSGDGKDMLKKIVDYVLKMVCFDVRLLRNSHSPLLARACILASIRLMPENSKNLLTY